MNRRNFILSGLATLALPLVEAIKPIASKNTEMTSGQSKLVLFTGDMHLGHRDLEGDIFKPSAFSGYAAVTKPMTFLHGENRPERTIITNLSSDPKKWVITEECERWFETLKPYFEKVVRGEK